MDVIYSRSKAEWLLKERKIDMDEVVDILLRDEILGIEKNPARPGQKVILIKYRGYVHALPYVFDAAGNIVIKTVYPARKFNKKYGGEK